MRKGAERAGFGQSQPIIPYRYVLSIEIAGAMNWNLPVCPASPCVSLRLPASPNTLGMLGVGWFVVPRDGLVHLNNLIVFTFQKNP